MGTLRPRSDGPVSEETTRLGAVITRIPSLDRLEFTFNGSQPEGREY